MTAHGRMGSHQPEVATSSAIGSRRQGSSVWPRRSSSGASNGWTGLLSKVRTQSASGITFDAGGHGSGVESGKCRFYDTHPHSAPGPVAFDAVDKSETHRLPRIR